MESVMELEQDRCNRLELKGRELLGLWRLGKRLEEKGY